MMTTRFVAIALVLPVAILTHGEPTTSPTRLTWKDCLFEAAKRNPDLLGARENVAAGRARYQESFNPLLPNLSLTQTYADTDFHLKEERWNSNATIGWDILNARSLANVSASGAAFSQAVAGRRLKSVDLRFSLRRAFVTLLTAQAEVAVAQRVKGIRRDNAERVSLKYNSGRESKGNTLQAGAELAQAEADLAQAKRALPMAQWELARQLGWDDMTEIVLAGEVDTPKLPPFPDKNASLDDHPRLAEVRAARIAAEANVRVARSDLWPALSATYSRYEGGEDFFSAGPHWRFNGQLSLPLFSGGPTAVLFASQAAARDLRRAEEDLRSALHDVRTALVSTWTDLAGKIDQVGVQRKFLEAARQRNEEATVRYSDGLMSFENWEQVVSNLVQYERGNLQAQADAAIAQAAWDQALGRLLSTP